MLSLLFGKPFNRRLEQSLFLYTSLLTVGFSLLFLCLLLVTAEFDIIFCALTNLCARKCRCRLQIYVVWALGLSTLAVSELRQRQSHQS
jgi:hypothetical protein